MLITLTMRATISFSNSTDKYCPVVMKCLNWIQNLIKLCVRLYVKIWFCIHIHIFLKIHTAAIYIEYKLAECHALFMKTTDNNYYLHTICSNIPRADIRICECFTCLHVSVVKKKKYTKRSKEFSLIDLRLSEADSHSLLYYLQQHSHCCTYNYSNIGLAHQSSSAATLIFPH